MDPIAEVSVPPNSTRRVALIDRAVYPSLSESEVQSLINKEDVQSLSIPANENGGTFGVYVIE